jgi:hypothetical protein
MGIACGLFVAAVGNPNISIHTHTLESTVTARAGFPSSSTGVRQYLYPPQPHSQEQAFEP